MPGAVAPRRGWLRYLRFAGDDQDS